MPTKREREYYAQGFDDGIKHSQGYVKGLFPSEREYTGIYETTYRNEPKPSRKPKRKLSAWNKFIKANAKKPRFRLRSGSPNLKKMAVAFRKTPAGKKKRR